ncbi:MAG TPA: hypothetical protein VGN78_03585 [Solirubrobacteraceae bacterium]|nr:hypothetical protein [Solirubrobacteraceae bacterium]
MLRGNWREGVRDGVHFAYTCPAPRRYVHQWYWDSCFHAIVWSRIEPRRARAELRTLLRAAGEDGLVPHTVFWDRPARWRRAPLYATLTVRGSGATASTQTPLLALAWERVAEASVDAPGFAAEGLDGLRRHYDWLARERDPDDDGLLSILHPDESGLDDSPKYAAAFGWMQHDRPGYFVSVERARRLGYRSRAVMAAGDRHVEDVLFNVAYALSLRALARLLGESPHAAVYRARAERTERALVERCLDERSGLFFDLAGAAERPLRVSTWSALAPLALTGLPDDVRRRLVEEHLLHPRRYRAPAGIPSVAMDEPAFRAGFDRFRTWRGPAWVNSAWLLLPAMADLGYETEAADILRGVLAAIDREGFREYYNPHTGRGHGARDFGWSTLVVDLVGRIA